MGDQMRIVVASREGMSDGSEEFGRLRFLEKANKSRIQYVISLLSVHLMLTG